MQVLKKRGVAILIAIVMIAAAIGVGYAKSPMAGTPAPDHGDSYHWEGGQYLRDGANVLSDKTLKALDQRNEQLWWNHGVVIGVVTGNYNGKDLADVAMDCAEEMGLDGNCMIVVLDISGENYWLSQGQNLRRQFTDSDCSDYAYEYMERDFARENYEDAVLNLTEALEIWYDEDY